MSTMAPQQQKQAKRRRKRDKDPNAPKRPRSSYILFCADKRNEAKAMAPDAGATDILRMLGKMWKALTVEEKAPWEAKAELDKDRYKADMAGYVRPALPRGKKKKDPNAPKRACSAYIFFGQAVREQIKADHPEAKNTDILKITGARWQKLTDEQKQIYVDQATADKERFERDMVAYHMQQQARQQAAQAAQAAQAQAVQAAQAAAAQAAAAAQQRSAMPGALMHHHEDYGVPMDPGQGEYRPPPPHHPHPHAHYGY